MCFLPKMSKLSALTVVAELQVTDAAVLVPVLVTHPVKI